MVQIPVTQIELNCPIPPLERSLLVVKIRFEVIASPGPPLAAILSRKFFAQRPPFSRLEDVVANEVKQYCHAYSRDFPGSQSPHRRKRSVVMTFIS